MEAPTVKRASARGLPITQPKKRKAKVGTGSDDVKPKRVKSTRIGAEKVKVGEEEVIVKAEKRSGYR